VYKQRHVLAKGLALSSTIDYRVKPLIERFGERAIAEIRTADIDDFVADLKRSRVVNGLDGRRLTPASINRTLGCCGTCSTGPSDASTSIGRRSGAAAKC
jgi:hypothetical protein